jgi:Zn-dependent protease with chaperone function
MNAVWLIWLPVYALSGIGDYVFLLLGPEHRDAAAVVNVALYFVPPMLALLLCDLASREVYRLVPDVKWSSRDFLRHAMATTSFSMMPLFIAILAINTSSRDRVQAAGYVIVSYVGWLLLNQTVRKVLAEHVHELEGGELRTRIYDLGQKAGVLLQHIYVSPDDRVPLATAGAYSNGSVMLTSSLLKHLSRREVDAIMAHEIGHLNARHPQRRGKILWGVVIGANLVGSFLAAKIQLQHSTEIVFSGALALSSLVMFFISRRNEQQADAIGVSLTGDPEAFISGLARMSRLSFMPLNFDGWGASLDTHPGTMRRFEIIAKAHGISDQRLQELLAVSETPDDRYPTLESEETAAIVHSFVLKHKYRKKVALVLIGVLIFSSIPFAFMLVKMGLSDVWLWSVAVAGILFTFGLYQLVRNRISFWGYDSLSRALKLKLKERGLEELARHSVLVGLSPASASRKYDGYPFWDAGVLCLTKTGLYYIGEQTEFALQRDQIAEIYSRNTNAEWLSEKSLFLRWKDDSNENTLHFVAVGENSVLKARRAIDALQKRFDSWLHQADDFPSTAPELESIAAPSFPKIDSRPAITSFRFASVMAAGIHLSVYAVVAGLLLRFGFLGVFYMAGVVLLCTLLDDLPKAFMRLDGGEAETVSSDSSSEPSTYQAGSWMDDDASLPDPGST